jgi:hypothetical protein
MIWATAEAGVGEIVCVRDTVGVFEVDGVFDGVWLGDRDGDRVPDDVPVGERVSVGLLVGDGGGG